MENINRSIIQVIQELRDSWEKETVSSHGIFRWIIRNIFSAAQAEIISFVLSDWTEIKFIWLRIFRSQLWGKGNIERQIKH